MSEIKMNVSIILRGRVMLTKEECLKTTQVNYTDKKGKKRTKFVEVEDPEKYETYQMQLKDYKTKKIETLHISVRKCREAKQSLNINKESYNYMIGKDSCGSLGVSQKHWNRMTKDQRLKAHLDEICKGLNGISYTYHIFED